MNTSPSQTLFAFEQQRIDAQLAAEMAKLNAKLAARAQKEAAKKQAEIEKSRRRTQREIARKQKTPDRVAVCGINFYTQSPRDRLHGGNWTHCRTCGKPLRFFDTYAEAQAHNTEPCTRR